MYTPDQLRQKADQCRRLAKGSPGRVRARRGTYLLELADQFEREAALKEHGGNKPNQVEPVSGPVRLPGKIERGLV
jgi:hypothetical protein